MRRTGPLGLLLLPVIAAWSVADDPPRQTLTAGHVVVELTPRRGGLSVRCDGLEVIRHSELVVTTPPWAPHYYVGPTSAAVAGAQRQASAAGEQLVITHQGERDEFEATETLTLSADGTLEQVFEGRILKADAVALLQWRMGALNPTLLVGCPFSATLPDGRTVSGTVPVTPRGSDVKDTQVALGFREVVFDGRSGPLRIEVLEAPGELIVYDFRRDKWASPQDPYFWFGDRGTRIRGGASVRYHVRYHLPAARDAGTDATPLRARLAITPCADAQSWPAQEPLLVPRPKQCTFSGELVAAERALAGDRGRDASAIVASDCDEAEPAAAELRRSSAERLGHEARPDAAAEAGPPLEYLRAAAADGLPAEGYELRVTPERIAITAGDAAGFRHGVRTLIQLLHVLPDGAVVFRGATIRDWPSLPFRGVHQFTGGQGAALHEQLLRNVIAALKLNHLVLECEYIEWDSAPEIHHPEFGMPKDDVRKILAVCRELGIEVTPLVMALGHCQWMFTNDRNLDLAEDPEAKWAYCVTNPRTYDFLFAIYTEALELFRPKALHIGHDEFDHRGRWPYRESTRGLSIEQIFVQDTLRLHDWLAERGVRTMMWGDMLLAKGEAPDATHAAGPEAAARQRAALPKDIIITDWHYVGAEPAQYNSLKLFQDAGHEVIAATWSQPRNIVHFARAAYDAGARGLLQTTWAGYSLDPASFRKEMHQYAAYVLAAEAAWNADQPPDPEHFPAGAVFLDRMGLSTLRPANRRGWTADLSCVCNYLRQGSGAANWFALGAEHDLSAAPRGRTALAGLMFDLGPESSNESQPDVLVLRSKLTPDTNLPSVVELELGQPAAQLALLHATNFACEAGAVVAECILTYADGQAQAVPLRYGQQAFAYTDLSPAAEAPLVWTGTTAGGTPVGLRVLLWDNPRPAVPPARLTIRSGEAAGSLMIFGLTGLDR